MLIGSSDSAEIARIILLTEFSCFQLLLQIKHQASFETKLQFVETGKGAYYRVFLMVHQWWIQSGRQGLSNSNSYQIHLLSFSQFGHQILSKLLSCLKLENCGKFSLGTFGVTRIQWIQFDPEISKNTQMVSNHWSVTIGHKLCGQIIEKFVFEIRKFEWSARALRSQRSTCKKPPVCRLV